MPNTARKPSVIAAVAASARPTAIAAPPRSAHVAVPHHQREVGGQHREAARVQRGHQSGGERQPDQVLLHSASATSGERRDPLLQFLLRHRRRRVVHERRCAVGAIEHVRRLPRHVVPRPDGTVGVVEVGEVQVVLRHEALHGRDVGASGDTDERHLGVGGCHTAHRRRLGVAERAPRRPEPQHGGLALQRRAVERRAAQRRSGEIEAIVGERGRRATQRHREDGSGHTRWPTTCSNVVDDGS